MSLAALLIHTVTIANPSVDGGADRYGNPTETTTSTTSKARVEQLKADEEIVNRDTRLTGYRVYLPADTDVDALSVLTWVDQGKTLRAIGEPNIVYGARGVHHLELPCEEVQG